MQYCECGYSKKKPLIGWLLHVYNQWEPGVVSIYTFAREKPSTFGLAKSAMMLVLNINIICMYKTPLFSCCSLKLIGYLVATAIFFIRIVVSSLSLIALFCFCSFSLIGCHNQLQLVWFLIGWLDFTALDCLFAFYRY